VPENLLDRLHPVVRVNESPVPQQALDDRVAVEGEPLSGGLAPQPAGKRSIDVVQRPFVELEADWV
jgi:hypothetical protein